MATDRRYYHRDRMVCHWDDVEREAIDRGELGGEGLNPNDICFYPRSGKLSVRGVRAIFRIERADYWDGEA